MQEKDLEEIRDRIAKTLGKEIRKAALLIGAVLLIIGGVLMAIEAGF
jgi:hypothetical protein